MGDPAFCHELDPDCNQCGKPIYWKSWICFQNKVWHKDCLKCIKCFVNFDQTQKQAHLLPILTEDGHLRCKSCFDEFEYKKIESRKKKNGGKTITIDWAKVNQKIGKFNYRK
jgi:LIM domain